jgi:predicted Rossmann fold nucleotide-binding protein DprA/Smf involved in DNA uptake
MGITLVGSRDLDPAGEAFAHAFAARCAEDGVTVISGGARGADRVSMMGALDAGGRAVGVLAGSLEQALRDREAAHFIRDEQLTLVTPFHPSAGFSVGNAMSRNKLLYCLAEFAVVVSSAEGSGGTWYGATENLDNGWVPLFVRDGADVPAGNRALIARGGLPVTQESLPSKGELPAWLREQTAATRQDASGDADDESAAGSPDGHDFDAVWPRLQSFLSEPRTEADVATAFGVEPLRAKAWLAYAAQEQRVEMATKRPQRYRLAAPRLL